MIEFGDKASNAKKEKFLNMMNDLATVWPGINNKSRLKKYYQYIERLPEKAWEDITDMLMDSFRSPPLPKDFKDAATAWKKSNEIYDKQDEFTENVNSCDECFDSGVIFVKVKPTEPTVFMYCNCNFGKGCSSNHFFVLPVWNKTFDEMGFVKQTFDLEFFKPKFEGEVTFKKMETVLDRFRAKLKSSRDYFEELPVRQAKDEISL